MDRNGQHEHEGVLRKTQEIILLGGSQRRTAGSLRKTSGAELRSAPDPSAWNNHRVDLMESYYEKALSQGKIVFCVVGCACTTSVGAHDNLKMLADFTEKHHVWFHVDGAHGGAAIFSDRYKYLLEGIERSDSLIVDFHKMMMTPLLSTAILYNAGNRKITR